MYADSSCRHSNMYAWTLQVKKVNFQAGETVGEGDIIVELEDV